MLILKTLRTNLHFSHQFPYGIWWESTLYYVFFNRLTFSKAEFCRITPQFSPSSTHGNISIRCISFELISHQHRVGSLGHTLAHLLQLFLVTRQKRRTVWQNILLKPCEIEAGTDSIDPFVLDNKFRQPHFIHATQTDSQFS